MSFKKYCAALLPEKEVMLITEGSSVSDGIVFSFRSVKPSISEADSMMWSSNLGQLSGIFRLYISYSFFLRLFIREFHRNSTRH